MGWKPRAWNWPSPAWTYLTTQAWLGPEKGFARTLARTGEVLDEKPDLYDHAFALFGFAWRHRADEGRGISLAWMHRTLDYIEGHMRHPGVTGLLARTAADRVAASRTRTCT